MAYFVPPPLFSNRVARLLETLCRPHPADRVVTDPDVGLRTLPSISDQELQETLLTLSKPLIYLTF